MLGILGRSEALSNFACIFDPKSAGKVAKGLTSLHISLTKTSTRRRRSAEASIDSKVVKGPGWLTSPPIPLAKGTGPGPWILAPGPWILDPGPLVLKIAPIPLGSTPIKKSRVFGTLDPGQLQ